LNPITKEPCEKYGLTGDVLDGIKYEIYCSGDIGIEKPVSFISTANMLSS
jgi:hypothetical protein